MIGLIFGGCCSNVFTLEKIVTHNPNSGNIITFFQFLFIAVEGFINFYDPRGRFFVKKNEVPLKRWSWTILMFFLISVLNNSVFIFKISIPIHIIFRSSGTVIVMVIGWLVANKTYNILQIISAIFLTSGAIITTLFKDTEITSYFKRDEVVEEATSGGLLSYIEDDMLFFIGIGVLTFAAILMAIMGLYNEETYRRYGKHWKENVFYSHLFGLPIFLLISPKLVTEFKELLAYPERFTFGPISIPVQLVYLLLNVLTQFFCVRGANMLAGNTTALTVSVVLLLRKFTSLILSLWLFDNRLSHTGSFGAALVFLGAFLYSYASSGAFNKKPVEKGYVKLEDHENKLANEVELKEVAQGKRGD